MKKNYLTCAGIIAAIVLAVMFAGILLTGSFTLFPSVAIDPIPDHAAGDLVVITGTTNLAAGTRLQLDIIPVQSASGPGTGAGETDAFIVRGPGMSNTWSGALDTSAIPAGEYRVNAYRLNDTGSRGDLLATSRLRLTSASDPSKLMRPVGKHQIGFITIDRPGTIYRGEKILITGTTNLPEGTGLLYTVSQQSNTSVFTVDPKTRKQELRGGFTRSGLITVLPGDNGASQWSFAIDSTEFIPDRYEVLVMQEPDGPGSTGTQGPFAAAPLVVLEAISDRTTSTVPDAVPCRSITIEPFPATPVNRTFTIAGATSLPPGTELLVQVMSVENGVSVTGGKQVPSQSITGTMERVEVTRGTGTINPWSVSMDLSRFPPKEYLVNVSNDRIDPRTYATIYGDAYCSEKLALPG